MTVTANSEILAALPAHVSDTAAGTAHGHGILQGRHLLVVGGGQQTYGQDDPPVGIGRAISLLGAREGASVAVADIDADAAQTTADRITKEGGTAYVLVGDSSVEADVARLVTEAAEHLGGLNAISLNVGVAVGDHLDGTTSADWDRIMATNLRSPFLFCRYTLPRLPPGASIVLTSSTAARVVSTTDSPGYAASKAALSGLCAYVAKEAALRRVRVNVVMPGLIDTSLGRLASLVKPDRDSTPIPLGRQGSGWDVAAAAAFLLSDAADYITGQTLAVDGGLSEVR
ncbi:MAG: SDR family NAD(P)-dependent oxidoreductase [Acidimicrobiales bacterium]